MTCEAKTVQVLVPVDMMVNVYTSTVDGLALDGAVPPCQNVVMPFDVLPLGGNWVVLEYEFVPLSV